MKVKGGHSSVQTRKHPREGKTEHNNLVSLLGLTQLRGGPETDFTGLL